MSSIIEVIKKRSSIRTYSNQEVTKEIKEKIEAEFQTASQSPLGSKVRFQLVQTTENERQELKELGTYGVIRGANLFIAGAVGKGLKAMEDFGYCMEKIILTATGLGLGTCWLGGSLNRSTFAKKMSTSADELIPAVTPLGYPTEKRNFRDNTIIALVGSKKRKQFGEIFFEQNLNKPLNMREEEKYFLPLEMVRLAPSASNKQPWRIIKETEYETYHFYLKENRIYNSIFGEIKLQNLDIGIAMCHFELTAKELGLNGKWEIKDPKFDVGNLIYIASWQG